MASAQPVTRRELRHAERAGLAPAPATLPRAVAAAREPAPSPSPTAVTRRALRAAERQRPRLPLTPPAAAGRGPSGRHSDPQSRRAVHRAGATRRGDRGGTWHPIPGHGPALGLLVAVAFVLGGITSVQSATAVRADRAEAAAAAAENARVARMSAAAEDRLTAQVMASAAVRRSEALDAATEALAAADAMLADAATVVGQETTDPLAQAAARLAALVQQAPDPDVVLGTEATGAEDPAAVPGADGLQASGVSATDVTRAAATPLAAVAGSAPETATTPPAVAIADPGTASAALPPLAESDPARAFEALDGRTSERLLAVAEEVAQLVEEVRQAAADAEATRAAAQQAAAQAAEAARVAAEQAAAAAAAELARKVAAADAAPNGEIPLDVLCGVSFDAAVLLRCDAAADLERLNAAFRDHFGRNMSITDSYRTYAGQVAARANKGDLAAAPGTSNHGRGLAIDLNGFGSVGEFDRPYYLWMSKHAGDYGWLHPSYMNPGGSGPLEPWHWEYRTA